MDFFAKGFLFVVMRLEVEPGKGGEEMRALGKGKKKGKIWVGWRWRGEHCPDMTHRTGGSPGVGTSRQGHPCPAHLISHPWRAPPQTCIAGTDCQLQLDCSIFHNLPPSLQPSAAPPPLMSITWEASWKTFQVFVAHAHKLKILISKPVGLVIDASKDSQGTKWGKCLSQMVRYCGLLL